MRTEPTITGRCASESSAVGVRSFAEYPCAMSSEATGTKYGLLVLPIDDADRAERTLTGGRTWGGRVDELLVPAEVAHWREWIGSMAWDEIVRSERRLVLISIPSARLDVVDAEDQQLEGDLWLMHRALLLAAPARPVSGRSWILVGGLLDDGRVGTLRSISETPTLPWPSWAQRENGYIRHLWDQPKDDWLPRWLELIDLLHNTALPELVNIAVLAYGEAFQQPIIEFRIPSFVRAAETIVALPKGVGGKEFSARVLRVAPHLASHWWAGHPDLGKKLEELFDLRSSCVHGKIPFLDLLREGTAGEDEAAWFDYLAEIVAREMIVFALRSFELQAAATDRRTLETAWKNGAFP